MCVCVCVFMNVNQVCWVSTPNISVPRNFLSDWMFVKDHKDLSLKAFNALKAFE